MHPALGKIGDTRAVKPLINLLENENAPYDLIGEALKEIGNGHAVEALLKKLEDKSCTAWRRYMIMYCLAKWVNDTRAMDALVQLLDDPNEFMTLTFDVGEKLSEIVGSMWSFS